MASSIAPAVTLIYQAPYEYMKCNSSGKATLKKDDINYSDPTDQGEILNEQFVSAFTKEDITSLLTKGTSTPNSAQPLNIQVNGVKKCPLARLYTRLRHGPYHTKILEGQCTSTAPAPTLIYQAFYEQGQIPDDWKRAFVTPLSKKGDEGNAIYRPVSMTSCCCKVVEHIMHISRPICHIH